MPGRGRADHGFIHLPAQAAELMDAGRQLPIARDGLGNRDHIAALIFAHHVTPPRVTEQVRDFVEEQRAAGAIIKRGNALEQWQAQPITIGLIGKAGYRGHNLTPNPRRILNLNQSSAGIDDKPYVEPLQGFNAGAHHAGQARRRIVGYLGNLGDQPEPPPKMLKFETALHHELQLPRTARTDAGLRCGE